MTSFTGKFTRSTYYEVDLDGDAAHPIDQLKVIGEANRSLHLCEVYVFGGKSLILSFCIVK